jgi:hypothetical protein
MPGRAVLRDLLEVEVRVEEKEARGEVVDVKPRSTAAST